MDPSAKDLSAASCVASESTQVSNHSSPLRRGFSLAWFDVSMFESSCWEPDIGGAGVRWRYVLCFVQQGLISLATSTNQPYLIVRSSFCTAWRMMETATILPDGNASVPCGQHLIHPIRTHGLDCVVKKIYFYLKGVLDI